MYFVVGLHDTIVKRWSYWSNCWLNYIVCIYFLYKFCLFRAERTSEMFQAAWIIKTWKLITLYIYKRVHWIYWCQTINLQSTELFYHMQKHDISTALTRCIKWWSLQILITSRPWCPLVMESRRKSWNLGRHFPRRSVKVRRLHLQSQIMNRNVILLTKF